MYVCMYVRYTVYGTGYGILCFAWESCDEVSQLMIGRWAEKGMKRLGTAGYRQRERSAEGES